MVLEPRNYMFGLKNVYVVDGSRTPFIRAEGVPGPFSASDLAVLAGKNLLARQPLKPQDIDEVIVGCVGPSEDEANIGRIVSLRLGCGKKTPAWTVQRNCASGMQAIDSAATNIAIGRADLVLAGGTEAMSRSPLLLRPDMVRWLASWGKAKTIPQKIQTLGKLKAKNLQPIIGLLRGLRDPVVGYTMGQTAEEIAHRFNISREDMDEFAMNSHLKLAQAHDDGLINEIDAIADNFGHAYTFDNGVRRDSSMEKLAKLRPVFDKYVGSVTAGNSSQITDGAAMLLLASGDAVEKYGLTPLAEIIDSEWSGLDPRQMGLGPVHSATPILKRSNLELNDIGTWEINEAFAAQVLGCVEAWKDDAYCQSELGLEGALGELDMNNLNVHGGAIATGHPVGASGARIVLHLIHALKHREQTLGMASICIGGGQGGAMLLERL